MFSRERIGSRAPDVSNAHGACFVHLGVVEGVGGEWGDRDEGVHGAAHAAENLTTAAHGVWKQLHSIGERGKGR